MLLVIDPQGQVCCLYGETIDLTCLGPLRIARAGHVEPEAQDWYADLAPLGGPRLGPFRLRSQALQAEIRWVEEFLAPPSPSPPSLAAVPPPLSQGDPPCSVSSAP